MLDEVTMENPQIVVADMAFFMALFSEKVREAQDNDRSSVLLPTEIFTLPRRRALAAMGFHYNELATGGFYRVSW